ncbi:hypothetical protein YC2023_008834 [Brassica napus]
MSTDYGVLCYTNRHEETLDRTLFVTFSFEVPLLQTVTDALIDGLNSFSPLLSRFLIQCTSLPVAGSCSTTVWEAKNVKRGGELMGVKRAMVSRGELTFQDVYGAEALLNEEDQEDDSVVET